MHKVLVFIDHTQIKNTFLHCTPSVFSFNTTFSFLCCVCCDDDSLAISRHNITDPRQKRTHFGVNTGEVRQGTALAPGDDSLQLSVTHEGSARVTLSSGGDRKSWMGPVVQVCFFFFHFIWCVTSDCVVVPGRSLYLPLGTRHTPCVQWSCRCRSFHSPAQTEWGRPHTGG